MSRFPAHRAAENHRHDSLTDDSTTSTGVLERPYCQMEIRHALALKKPLVLLHGE